MQRITNNLKGIIRRESLNGHEYAVVPVVMLTEGVHNGSNGPLYYPKDELAKTPALWNMKPIVVYHPEMNGQPISASDVSVIRTRMVGMIMNAVLDSSVSPAKLRAEAWLDLGRVGAVDDRVLNAINKGLAVEVSTGVFTDNVPEAGIWNGEQYVAIARNYRADHLAILPDKKGACSMADGCGMGLQLNADGMEELAELVAQKITGNCDCHKGATQNKWSDAARKAAQKSRQQRGSAFGSKMGKSVGAKIRERRLGVVRAIRATKNPKTRKMLQRFYLLKSSSY